MDIPDIRQYKNQIFNIMIIVLALIIANVLYKNQARTAESLKIQKEEAIRVNELLSQISASESEINLYKDALGVNETSELINEINSIAKQSEVKIISIKPGEKTLFSSYSKQKFEISVTSPSSHYIGKFVNGLENSSAAFIVEDFNEASTTGETQYGQQEEGAGEGVIAKIILNAISVRG